MNPLFTNGRLRMNRSILFDLYHEKGSPFNNSLFRLHKCGALPAQIPVLAGTPVFIVPPQAPDAPCCFIVLHCVPSVRHSSVSISLHSFDGSPIQFYLCAADTLQALLV